jgi:UPF0148 protein
MAHKKEDEIMAEYLLKGGKMLEKTCRTCGCPMFEYKGTTFCVVCAEREQENKGKEVPQTGKPPGTRIIPVTSGGVQGPRATPAPMDTAALEEELVATVRNLCARIRTDEDPDRCLALMDSVKIGIEALTCLRQR